jgi:hypothetical protein
MQQKQLIDIQAQNVQQQQRQPSTTAPTVKKFGSWFPTATTVKGGHVTGNVCICLFYQYITQTLDNCLNTLCQF